MSDTREAAFYDILNSTTSFILASVSFQKVFEHIFTGNVTLSNTFWKLLY